MIKKAFNCIQHTGSFSYGFILLNVYILNFFDNITLFDHINSSHLSKIETDEVCFKSLFLMTLHASPEQNFLLDLFVTIGNNAYLPFKTSINHRV